MRHSQFPFQTDSVFTVTNIHTISFPFSRHLVLSSHIWLRIILPPKSTSQYCTTHVSSSSYITFRNAHQYRTCFNAGFENHGQFRLERSFLWTTYPFEPCKTTSAVRRLALKLPTIESPPHLFPTSFWCHTISNHSMIMNKLQYETLTRAGWKSCLTRITKARIGAMGENKSMKRCLWSV